MVLEVIASSSAGRVGGEIFVSSKKEQHSLSSDSKKMLMMANVMQITHSQLLPGFIWLEVGGGGGGGGGDSDLMMFG